MVIPQLVAGRAAAAARAPLLQAVVRAAAVVHRAVGEAHLWAEEHRRSARRGRGGTASRAPTPASAPRRTPGPAPRGSPALSALPGQVPASPCRQKRPSQPRPQSQRKPPMPSMHVPWPQHALSHGCSGGRTSHWSPSATWVSELSSGRQPPPRPHSRPDTSRRRGRGHRSKESGEHSPKYLDQKASCGEKRPRQALSAHVCIRGPS